MDNNIEFGMDVIYFSAYALSATELTGQKKIDLYRLGQKINSDQSGIDSPAEGNSIINCFMSLSANSKRICLLASDGVVVVNSSYMFSQSAMSTPSEIRINEKVEVFNQTLLDLLLPQYHIIKKASSIRDAERVIPDIIAATNRQSFAWYCCRWR